MGMVSDWIVDATTSLVGKLKDAAAGMLGKMLATFGLTTVTFNGIRVSLDTARRCTASSGCLNSRIRGALSTPATSVSSTTPRRACWK